MRAKVYLKDGTCHDLLNCREGGIPMNSPNILKIKAKECTYHFNMDCVKYVQTFMEDENDENA